MRTPYCYYALLGLGLLSAQAFSASSEVGIKGGYQLYSNDLGNPSSFGKGVFLNTPISDHWSVEGGLLLLGEAEEGNHNVGAFNAAELSGLYAWDLGRSELFGKAGLAPWFGYMSMPNGGQGYEYGLAAVLGAGYRFPLYGPFNGRVEYQYLPNLGGETIGYSDSHFVSLGLSWRTDSTPLLGTNESSVSTSPYVDITQVPANKGAVGGSTSIASDTSSDERKLPRLNASSSLRELYGTWLFENNSSALVPPKPFTALDAGRAMFARGCTLTDVSVEGYADGVGDERYNQWLSERRASKVANYLARALGSPEQVDINSFGSTRPDGAANVSFYERRVDFRLRFQCWDK